MKRSVAYSSTPEHSRGVQTVENLSLGAKEAHVYDILANAVLDTLQEIFGDAETLCIVHMIAELNQSSRERVLRDPKAIHFGLLGLFGVGGKIIERMILQKMLIDTEVRIDPEGNFLEEIEKIISSYLWIASIHKSESH